MAKTNKSKETNNVVELEKNSASKKTSAVKTKKVEIKSTPKLNSKSASKQEASKSASTKGTKKIELELKASPKKETNTKNKGKEKEVTNKETSKVTNDKSTTKKTSKAKVKKETIAPIIEHVEVEPKIIAEPIQGEGVKLEVISVLQPQIGEAPLYTLQEAAEMKTSHKIDFHKIIPHDDIIEVLNKANYEQVDQNLQKILLSILRGSDVFVLTPDFKEEFLIAPVCASYKILSGALTRIEAKQPLVLVVGNDEKKLNEFFIKTAKVFSPLKVNFTFLSSEQTAEEKKDILEKHIDVLFTTVQNLGQIHESFGLNLSSVGLCFVYELQNIAQNNFSNFTSFLKLIPQERVQKIFIANENTPKSRELAFSYLNDLEYFYLLPSYIKDRSPKQFAHALPAVQKFQVLLGHLKHHKPMCAAVFANTKTVAEWLAYKLHGNGIKVELLTSELNFTKKQQLIKAVRCGEVNVIITTDYKLSNFGLEGLNCLYHFDLPESPEKFIERLNLIEKSRSPISVSFICEDYGYNMGKIEEKLGFKIHVVNPDKDYFNIKDTSDYPLEADGRVKRIGQVSAPQVVQASVAQASVAQAAVAQAAPSSASISNERTQPRMQPRHIAGGATSNFMPRGNFENKQQNKIDNKFQNKFDNKQQDKFIRRDDKAKEAIDAARMAAQEKRNAAAAADHQQKTTQRKNILSIAVFIMQDALKAAATAAKESIATNVEKNLPMFSGVLSKVSFLKKEKENN